MRIGILTFHRCINYGSYWQARCLLDGLRAYGHDAVLLDHHCERARRAELRCAFQPLLPARAARRDLPLYGRKIRRLLAAVDALPRSRRFPLEAPEELGEFDLIVVGSDEVWNVRHPWYARRPAFFGEGLPARRIVSYAASFGNHDVEDGLCSPWSDMLRRFDLLSVRDRNSHELVRRAVDRDAAVVLDPCLQFPPETETAQAADGGRQLYIAVYGHSFPAWFTAAIRAFAARVGKPLLSIGYRNDWADEQRIDAGPEEFRRLIARAAAVATNFFHGAVFSLLGNRPFACVASAYRANKLRDLTNLLEIEERLVEDDNAAQAMLGTPLERRVASRIGELREQSDRYLVSALA